MKKVLTIALACLCALMLTSCSSNRSSSKSTKNDSYYSRSTTRASSYEMSHATYCRLYMKVNNVKVKHERNYTYVTGSVKNTGTYQVKFVKVKAVCKDYSGNIIDTDWTYAVDSTWLDPGESKTFEMMVRDPDGKIKKADVTVISD